MSVKTSKKDGTTIQTNIEKAIENSSKSAKEGRLIVRNVGFGVNVEKLRERFQDFGEIVEVVLPPSKRTSPVSADGRRMKIPPHAGYAFVEFDTREQAQSAMTAVNGSRIGGRPVAVDFAYDARLFKLIKEKGGGEAKSEAPKATVQVEAKKEVPRESVKRDVPSSVVESEVTQPIKKQKSTSAKGESEADARKLFLVNVPFDAERGDVVSSVSEFGKVEQSDIESVMFVKDKETKKPTGKCFIVFGSVSSCEKVLNMEKSAVPELFGDLYKKDKHVVAPLEGAGCIILGRRVSILKPLSKDELEKQKREKEDENQPKNPKVVNRKNIDYVNAGWINETHEEIWNQLSLKDQQMRAACNEEKKFKLKNPNFVINTKRLTIRNVPKRMENGDLQAAIIRAMGIKGAKKSKQAGITKVAIVKDKIMVVVGDRKPTETDFDMNAPESDGEDEKKTTSLEMKEKKRSRGFAFVDLVDSERALKCLEAMNNVPGAFGDVDPKRRPIVEFSFDDVRKLQIQQQRAIKQANKRKDDVKPAKAKPSISKKLSRGQKQREKRRAQREAVPSTSQ